MTEAETPFPKALNSLTHVYYCKDENSERAHSMIWTNGK